MKRLVSLILTVILTVSLVACGGNDNTSKENETKSGQEVDVSSEKTVTSYGEYTKDSPYQLEFAYPNIYQQDEQAVQNVQDALNEYMIEKYHIQVTFLPLQWASMMSDLQMMIAGGDKLDILPMPYQNATGFLGMEGLVDIKEYLDNTPEGQKIIETIGSDLAYAGNINNIIYGLPAIKESSVLGGLCMRADICDELGLTEKYNLDSSDEYQGKYLDWDAAEDIFKTVKAAYPEMTALYSSASQGPEQLQELAKYDTLQDRMGVLNWEEDHDSTTVVNMFETNSFKEAIHRLASWYDAGYINKDAATAQEIPTNMIRAGQTFSYLTGIKPGFLAEAEANNGQKMYAAYFGNYTEGLLISNNINYINTCIATNSEDPDMAFKFLSALYTDPTVMNFWQYGIENVNYQIQDDGTIFYVEGENDSNFKYHQNTGWAMGNQFISYVWNDGTKTSDYWNKLEKHDMWSLHSPAYGFMWDGSAYTTELTALNNVLNTYYAALTTGSIGVDNVDAMIDEMNQALYTAGLQKVIDEKQRQLDEWIKVNGGSAVTPQENIDLINSAQ